MIAILCFHLQIFTETLPHTRHVSIIKHNEEILSHRITGTRETDIANFSDKTRTTPIQYFFIILFPTFISVHHFHGWGPRDQKMAPDSQKLVTDSWEPLCRCWGRNLSLLQGSQFPKHSAISQALTQFFFILIDQYHFLSFILFTQLVLTRDYKAEGRICGLKE